MDKVGVGGGMTSLASPFQNHGVGRFPVQTDGVVSPEPSGQWRYDALITGRPDLQDYPHDEERRTIEAFGNDLAGEAQKFFGGKSYPLTFFGAQKRSIGSRPK
jgi:hypothetical protein